jgi:hypothetical protein
MKKQTLFFIFMCIFLGSGALTVVADEVSSNIETKIIDDFDSSTTLNGKDREWFWYLRGSKFAIEDTLECKLVPAYPDTLYTKKQAEGKDLHVLGIKGGFERKGYNYLEIIPVKKDEEGKIKSYPIPLPGMVKQVALWVWSGDFNYYIEVFVEDENGVNHRLYLGDMNFEGWKSLIVNVPSAIPQSRRSIIKNKALLLTKIVIWTRPQERVNDFSAYFDQLKVNTDTFITKFDGDELADPEEVNRIWTEGQDIQPK